MACIPTLIISGNKTTMVRLCTSTQDKTFDIHKKNYPVLFSKELGSTVGTLNTLYNATEFFYNINVPSNFLSNGYIDIEL